MSTEQNDVVVAQYLSQVTRATAGMSPERQEELLSDLREHIEAGRADLTEESEVQVREILDRLGDPIMIAQAAAAENTGVTPAIVPPPRSGRTALMVTVVVIVFLVIALFCFGAFFFTRNSSPA